MSGQLRAKFLFSGLGHYIYIESSSPRVQGDKADLVSPLIPGGHSYCLQFALHMYGSHLGSVNIYVLVCIQYTLLYNSYISTGDNPRALASRVSPVQSHKPYNNVLIDLACICTLRIVRKM